MDNEQGRIQGWWTGGQGGGVWVGGAPSQGEESGEGAVPPPQNFLNFYPRNGAFLCILLMTGGMAPGPPWSALDNEIPYLCTSVRNDISTISDSRVNTRVCH